MLKLVLIFLAAGVGGILRYTIGGVVQSASGSTFPLGTLVVNVSGCLTIGFLAAAFEGPWLVREETRLTLLIGLLGGYTTFSTFGRETLALLNDGQYAAASANVILSNVLGLGAAWAGWAAATRILGNGGGPT